MLLCIFEVEEPGQGGIVSKQQEPWTIQVRTKVAKTGDDLWQFPPGEAVFPLWSSEGVAVAGHDLLSLIPLFGRNCLKIFTTSIGVNDEITLEVRICTQEP